MKLRYLNLSNLLLEVPNYANDQWAAEAVQQHPLLQALLTLIQDWRSQDIFLDFIVVTGNLSKTGKRDEFQIADVFFQKLLEAAQLSPQRLFLVPGSHDVEQDPVPSLYAERLYAFEDQETLSEHLSDEDSLEMLTSKFETFHQFAPSVMKRPVFETMDYFWSIPLVLDKQGWTVKVHLHGLNSCLFTGTESGTQDRAVLGLTQVKKALSAQKDDTLLSMACFHHAFSALDVVDQASEDLLKEKVDVILTGDPEQAGLHYAEWDLTSGAGSTQHYEYDSEHGFWSEVIPDAAPETVQVPAIQEQYRAHLETRPPLYLAKIEISNMQCFEQLSVDFVDEFDDVHMWLMCLGDNSTGKSSFLRCLALGMVQDASALLQHYQGPLVRHGAPNGKIVLELVIPDQQRYRLVSTIKKSPTSERIEKACFRQDEQGEFQAIRALDFPWDQLFVCGYGAGRIIEEDVEKKLVFESYNALEAVRNLFYFKRPLQHVEFSLRRIIDAADETKMADQSGESPTLQRFETLLAELFMFAAGEKIELTSRGLEVVRGRRRTPLMSEGDGYKSTAGWVLDLITWNMLKSHAWNPAKMSGIVLMDEMDQHLHPRWQRYLIRLLQKQFPQIQFVVTSHSSLCAAGLTDLPDEVDAKMLKFQGDSTIEDIDLDRLRGLKADQVLTSEAFELPTTRSPTMAEKLERMATLYLKDNRDDSEEEELQQLQSFVAEYLPESAEDSETRVLQQKLRDLLDELQKVSPSKEES